MMHNIWVCDDTHDAWNCPIQFDADFDRHVSEALALLDSAPAASS